MNKILFACVLLLVVAFASCSQKKETVDPSTPVSTTSRNDKSASWHMYPAASWSRTGGSPTFACYAVGSTNQNAKKSVVTVSCDNGSVGGAYVSIYVTNSLCGLPGTLPILTTYVGRGKTFSSVVNVSGYSSTENRIRVNIEPDGSTGTRFGFVTVGYEL